MDRRSRWPQVGVGALFACLVGGATVLALSRPLCCADDAAHAVIAKESDSDPDGLRTECTHLLLGYLTGRARDESASVDFFDVWG